MKYRIKKITSKTGKVWYMPQTREKILFFNYWKDLDNLIPITDLGYNTKKEAIRRINTRQLIDESVEYLKNSMVEEKKEYIFLNENEIYFTSEKGGQKL